MIINNRQVDHDIHPQFPQRWSPRAMSGESIDLESLKELFEAARWSPSNFNGQPWRFIFAQRGTAHWDTLFNLLSDWNKAWCRNAGVLVVVVSRNDFEYNNNPNITHSFDTGSAWMSIALQASLKELIAHGMSGFDYGRAKKDLSVPDGFTVEAMIAVGKPGKRSDLPEEIRKAEVQSGRKKVEEIMMEGRFTG